MRWPIYTKHKHRYVYTARIGRYSGCALYSGSSQAAPLASGHSVLPSAPRIRRLAGQIEASAGDDHAGITLCRARTAHRLQSGQVGGIPIAQHSGIGLQFLANLWKEEKVIKCY